MVDNTMEFLPRKGNETGQEFYGLVDYFIDKKKFDNTKVKTT